MIKFKVKLSHSPTLQRFWSYFCLNGHYLKNILTEDNNNNFNIFGQSKLNEVWNRFWLQKCYFRRNCIMRKFQMNFFMFLSLFFDGIEFRRFRQAPWTLLWMETLMSFAVWSTGVPTVKKWRTDAFDRITCSRYSSWRR